MEHAECRRLVYTSTVGDDRRRRTTDSSRRSATLVKFEHLFGHYKRSKYLAEHEVLRAGAAGLPVVLVHPTFPVGEGDSAPTPTGRTILEFLNGRIPAYVDTALNVVHVDDVARGHVLAARHGRPGRSYVLGGENMTLQELLGHARRACAASRRRTYGCRRAPCSRSCAPPNGCSRTVLRTEPVLPSEPVRMATTRMEYDDSRARSELGYTSIPAREALGACGKMVRGTRLRQRFPHGNHPPRRQARNGDRLAGRARSGSGTEPGRPALSARRVPRPRRVEPRPRRVSAVPAPAEADGAFDVRALLEARGHEAFALHERYVNPQMPRVLRTIGFDADYVRAEGAYLFDRDGRRYLDFLAGFGVFALGRCHPGIEQALRDAMALSLPNLVQMECSPLSGLLAEALVARMPNDVVSLLLHEQRRGIGRDRAEVRSVRHGSLARAVRGTCVPRSHHGRARAERRPRVPRPVRHAPARLRSGAVR